MVAVRVGLELVPDVGVRGRIVGERLVDQLPLRAVVQAAPVDFLNSYGAHDTHSRSAATGDARSSFTSQRAVMPCFGWTNHSDCDGGA